MFQPLENPILPYAWGSRSAISELLGCTIPSPTPQAELWLGAHPTAPSRIAGSSHTLLECISADPCGALGERIAAAHGQLPFLMKVLAADTPLSLQAHPTLEQARRGFADEEQRGIPRDSRERNYRDPNHKPELIAALSPFWALSGFRPVKLTARLFAELDVQELSEWIPPLHSWPAREALHFVFEQVMAPGTAHRDLPARVTEAAAACLARGSEFAETLRWTVRLGELYPGDLGVVSALLLNVVHLKPGQSMFLGAGSLHAYLQGVGVEIMANSDNVLRGGLTSKHVDVPELLRVLDFSELQVSPVEPHALSTGELVYPAAVPEFRLSRWEISGPVTRIARSGPEIVLVTEGEVALSRPGQQLLLRRGCSAFIPMSDGSYDLSGQGTLFRATVP